MNTLQNLKTLRDVVFPKVFELDKQGRVDLNRYQSECGTYACLWGWYCVIALGAKRITSRMGDDGNPESESHFGISCDEDMQLFGSGKYNALQDRYDYLCQLIAEREAENVIDFQKMAEELSKRPMLEHKMNEVQNNLEEFARSA